MDPLILVIDDDEASLTLTRRQLERLNRRAKAVRGGHTIPADIAADTSLVLLDCQMPVMDGFAVTRSIRRHEISAARHVPIVAMTADATPENRMACLAAGMDDVVTKPIGLEQLSAILDRWLPASAGGGTTNSGDPKGDGPPKPADSATPAAWLRVEMGDDDAVARIVHMYLDRLEERSLRIDRALEGRDFEELIVAAHALKGPSSLVGAADVADSCRALEDAGRTRNWQSAARDRKRMKDEIDRAREALESAFP